MQTLFVITAVILVVFVLRIIITKSRLNEAKQLNEKFILWSNQVKSSENNKEIVEAPNNHAFVRLCKIVYPGKTFIVNTSDTGTYAGHRAIFNNEASVLESFPTTHHSLIGTEMIILGNIVDYFDDQYQQNFKFSYWLNLLIFLPQKVVTYLGIKEDSVASKLLNVFYWITLVLYSIYRPLLLRLIDHLLR